MSEKFETRAIRTQMERSKNSEHSSPLYLTSSFVFESAEDMSSAFAEEKKKNIYSRFTNPNTTELIQKISQMEGAEDGVAFASGMGAIYSTFATFLNSGDHIVSCNAIFGSTHTLFTKYFPRWNISTSYFPISDLNIAESLIQQNTKCIYAESPTNPGVDIIDLEAIGKLAKKHNILLIIDNCFATPYLQKPISFGADLVIHSATKLLDGQGRVLGGVTVGKKQLIEELFLFARNTGASLSPFNAWVLSKSLETLSLRVDRHSDNALKIAHQLEKQTNVNRVKYPFLKSHPQYHIAKKQMLKGGNIISFEVEGGSQAARDFIDSIKMCSISANLGDSRTIITHPASSTHTKLSEEERLKAGITDGMIRLSVGLEHHEDIWNDIKNALKN
ncbi:MAG: aminotransferase class I/II-fold pyridoxal phosphate-dependent enzyme [Flavobacteriaceae bacterium]|nr:aminotransferase class I/II-fold pyridoxal phosphate-dependent enzyme [Flavobacteriaceae bacterium]